MKALRKDNFTFLSILSNHICLGSVVFIKDGSWMMKKEGKSAVRTEGLAIGRNFGAEPFQVIGINKSYPTEVDFLLKDVATPINNIKVQNLLTGDIFYGSNGNFKSISHGYENPEDKTESCVLNGKMMLVCDALKEYKFYNKNRREQKM